MSSADDDPAASFLQKRQAKADSEDLRRGTIQTPAPTFGTLPKPPTFGSLDSDDEEDQAAAQVPNVSVAAKQKISKVWSSHECGADALEALDEVVSSDTTFDSILVFLVSMLPISVFAPTHSKWKSTPITSLAVFVSVFKTSLPDLYSAVSTCATLEGSSIRPAIKLATSQMFGTFGDTVHSVFIYAVMVFIWSEDASPMSVLLRDLMVAYMSVEQDDLASFLTGSADPYSLSCVSAAFDVAYDAGSIKKTHGWSRLNSDANPDYFAAHWKFCVEVCV